VSATYDPTLPTDRDWVRFLSGDRVVASAVLQDEEIDALIAEQVSINGSGNWTKYLAAAMAAGVILNKDGGSGTVTSKTVGNLSIDYGSNDSADSAYRAYMKSLQERGCALLLKAGGNSHVLRML